MADAQQPATSLNITDAYEISADWHDKQARGCDDIAADEPRIASHIRERARVAAIHHLASAAGLRLAAVEIRRKVFTPQPDSLRSENSL